MRHLVSIILSLILAAVIYVAAGFSAVKLSIATASASIDWAAAGLGIAGALLAGACYALLVMTRLSPFGPVLAGLGYLGVTLWAVLDKTGFAGALPSSFLGENGVLQAPVGAGTLLLAVPLLATVFSARRWRGKSQPASDSAAPVYPDEVSAAPKYDTAAASYEPPVYTPSTTAEPATSPSEGS